jgi:phosphatidylglycerophosphatase A
LAGRDRSLDLRDPRVLAATWFGVGLVPLAPGTAGSATALPFAWLLLQAGGPPALLAAAALVLALGLAACGAVVRATGDGDPGPVVIDEVAGQWLALLPASLSPWSFLAGFLLFRALDIVKPWPAGAIDRRLGGAPGIMLDDVVAGAYAALVLLLLEIWILP